MSDEKGKISLDVLTKERLPRRVYLSLNSKEFDLTCEFKDGSYFSLSSKSETSHRLFQVRGRVKKPWIMLKGMVFIGGLSGGGHFIWQFLSKMIM